MFQSFLLMDMPSNKMFEVTAEEAHAGFNPSY